MLSHKAVQLRRRRVASRALPGDVFARMAREPGVFFLDSGGGNRRLAQWSFLGSAPRLTLCGTLEGVCESSDQGERFVRGNPLDLFWRAISSHRLHDADDGAPPFTGGAVGFFGYDLKHLIERLPFGAVRDTNIPDLYFSFYDSVLAYDHIAGEWWALALEADDGLTIGRKRPDDELQRLARRVESAVPTGTPAMQKRFRSDVTSNFTREEYLRAVARAKDYITAGDIFQVNLSQRLEARLAAPPEELYRVLRTINPAPFAAYLAWDNWAIASTSPERYLLLADDHVWTRPIKGTRKRTGDPRADEALSADLLASEKDRAELVMIMDLERNDLGRVCEYGSVRVTEAVTLEEYPTVFHLVGTVEGDLHEGRNPIDLVKASFPGGSITGAPKVRAMEIIDELEPTARNLYTGAIGYIGFDGVMDLNIAIRTFLITGDRATFQIGGGIVADSDPAAEYEETLHKGRALLDALGYRGSSFTARGAP